MSELPPTATTASLPLGAICHAPRPEMGLSAVDRSGERRDRTGEAGHRSTGDAGADLTNSCLVMCYPGVDHRQNAGVHHLADIDAGGRAAEIKRREGEG